LNFELEDTLLNAQLYFSLSPLNCGQKTFVALADSLAGSGSGCGWNWVRELPPQPTHWAVGNSLTLLPTMIHIIWWDLGPRTQNSGSQDSGQSQKKREEKCPSTTKAKICKTAFYMHVLGNHKPE